MWATFADPAKHWMTRNWLVKSIQQLL